MENFPHFFIAFVELKSLQMYYQIGWKTLDFNTCSLNCKILLSTIFRRLQGLGNCHKKISHCLITFPLYLVIKRNKQAIYFGSNQDSSLEMVLLILRFFCISRKSFQ